MGKGGDMSNKARINGKAMGRPRRHTEPMDALLPPLRVTTAMRDAYRAAPASVQAEARAAMRAALMAVISKESEGA